MKKISLLITLIFFTSSVLYAAKPCHKMGGLVKVSNYEECMKNPDTYKEKASVIDKLNEKKKNFDDNNKTIWDMIKNKKK